MQHPLERAACKPRARQRFTVEGVSYVLQGKVGDGAAGIVRRATRYSDGAEFAVKFLAPDPKYLDVEIFDDVAARFRREGERGARLSHPSLLRIHSYVPNDAGEAFSTGTPQNPFILMEYVRGRTLESYIRERSKEEGVGFAVDRERLVVALRVAEALRYLHRRALTHRDVKPANLFLCGRTISERSRIKLGDFGIMKWGDFHGSLTTGSLTATTQRGLGTVKYMSPEQAIRPKDVTVRSDIYSFGITLFELFTSRILPSPHHVFQIMDARLRKGTTDSRYRDLGHPLRPAADVIAEAVLDMHRRGVSGRPPIEKVWGNLAFTYERLTGEDWSERQEEG